MYDDHIRKQIMKNTHKSILLECIRTCYLELLSSPVVDGLIVYCISDERGFKVETRSNTSAVLCHSWQASKVPSVKWSANCRFRRFPDGTERLNDVDAILKRWNDDVEKLEKNGRHIHSRSICHAHTALSDLHTRIQPYISTILTYDLQCAAFH